MKILIISCSLHPQSRSFVLARQVQDDLAALEAESTLIDLRDRELAFCDATTAHKTPEALDIIQQIREATVVLLAVPIYNFYANAATKNLLEIGLRAWNHKLVGFLCAAGGRASYMSVMNIANSLMLDFRCIIIPRFVYATGSDFADDRQPHMSIASIEIQSRIQELAETTVKLGSAIKAANLAG